MHAERKSESPMKNFTNVERKSDREVAATRTFNAPPRIVWEAWTKAELFRRWWVPKSFNMKLLSCEIDARVGGGYKLVFAHPAGGDQTMAFFGKYLEVTPPSRLVWSNDEGGEQGSVTTVTLEEKGGQTLLTISDLYPSKEALDANIGATSGWPETFDQLEGMLAEPKA